MANVDRITISHPQTHNTVANTKAIPGQFAAVGAATGDRVLAVFGELVSTTDPSRRYFGKQAVFISKNAPNGYRYRWMLTFGCDGARIPPGAYTLKVTGLDRSAKNGGGQPIPGAATTTTFEVRPLTSGAPVIVYPLDGQNVTDEVSDLIAYGTCSDPIAVAEIGGQAATTIYNDPVNSFWSAEFLGVTATGGDVPLSVTDSVDQGAAIDVVISSPSSSPSHSRSSSSSSSSRP
jgi:hypothetical protein